MRAAVRGADVIRSPAEWEAARVRLQFRCPFPPPTQAACDAVCALGDTGMAAAGLVVVNRILRLQLDGNQSGVRLMKDLQRAAHRLAPLGVSVDVAKNIYTLRYDNGSVQVQHAKRHNGVDMTVSLGVAEHLDALVITTVFAQLAAAGYTNIVADRAPRLDNIVLHGKWPSGRFDCETMREAVREHTQNKDDKRGTFKACAVHTQYHQPGGVKPRKCVFLFFPAAGRADASSAIVVVNMYDEATASRIMALMLPQVWPFVHPA